MRVGAKLTSGVFTAPKSIKPAPISIQEMRRSSGLKCYEEVVPRFQVSVITIMPRARRVRARLRLATETLPAEQLFRGCTLGADQLPVGTHLRPNVGAGDRSRAMLSFHDRIVRVFIGRDRC